MPPPPRLLLCAGLPGTGKSTLAAGLGRALNCPVFAKDWLEAALWRSGVGREQNSGWAGYELLTALAESQLRLGQPALLDCVAGREPLRRQWRALAAQYGAAFRPIECVCADEALHQARLSGRQRGIPGWYELDWAEVERVRAGYEPWETERLVLDMAADFEHNLAAALAYVKGEAPP
jgi:predicted kinase